MSCLYKALAKILNFFTPNRENVSHEWKPFMTFDNSDLNDVKLIDCSCMSSHNSTINSFQIFGNSNLNNLLKTINLNFRMIELDVFTSHKHKSSKPVVSHGRTKNNLQVTSSVSFEKCIKMISEYAWRCTDLPLFLTLEVNTKEPKTLIRVNEILLKYLSERMIPDIPNKSLKNYTISELRGKIVLISSTESVISNQIYLQNVSHTHSGILNRNELSRIYPNNKILSKNYSFFNFPYINFISMNTGYSDKHLKNYLAYFAGEGIILRAKENFFT